MATGSSLTQNHSRSQRDQGDLHTLNKRTARKAYRKLKFLDGAKCLKKAFDPETKRQSNEWHTPQSPRQKKARMSKSRMKAMLIVFFDKNGVVHSEFVPEGQAVNGAFYMEVLKRLKRRVNRVRPEISANWKLHHDKAPSHTFFRGYRAHDKKWHRNNSTASLQPRPCPCRLFPLN
ncbi:putative DD34D transposase [Trichonephila clavipes]|nr:putative DD34D transposase [Trichonephila clavipes]